MKHDEEDQSPYRSMVLLWQHVYRVLSAKLMYRFSRGRLNSAYGTQLCQKLSSLCYIPTTKHRSELLSQDPNFLLPSLISAQ